MNKNNIKRNAILNVIKSCLSMFFPLITYPIVLRALGTAGVGKITYVQSIVSYFSLLAMMGVSTYAVREGAKRREDKVAFRLFSSEVFTINICFTILSCLLLLLLVLFVPRFQNYQLIFIILMVNLIFQTFSVDWINTVFEDYKFITIRSIITYIISFVLIIIFIKQPEDYIIYTILLVIPTGIVCITNWAYCRKYVRIKLTTHTHFKTHIKSLLLLFSNSVMVSIYVNFDTTMLGWIRGDYYVGLYAVSVKLYTVVKGLMMAVYTVAIPSLSLYASQKEWNLYRTVFSDMSNYLTLLLIPISTGMICVAKEIIFFMGGKGYFESVLSFRVLSIALLFSIFGGLLTSCLNISLGKEKVNLEATVISALINCGLNIVFIPLLGHNGAAITTLLSEAFVVSYSLVKLPNKSNYMDFVSFKHNLIDAVVGSTCIVVITICINLVTSNLWCRLVIITILSVIAYGAVLLLRKNTYLVQVVNTIKGRIIKSVAR